MVEREPAENEIIGDPEAGTGTDTYVDPQRDETDRSDALPGDAVPAAGEEVGAMDGQAPTG